MFMPIVAVPAKNEERRLPVLLNSLAAQDVGCILPVVIVLNNTRDNSRKVVEEQARHHPSLAIEVVEVNFPEETAHVGSARRMAMDTAAERVRGRSGVVLTTDADASPSRYWVAANLQAIAKGADLVGGRIIGNKDEEAALGTAFQHRVKLHANFMNLCDELANQIDPLDHDSWPRHHDHTGASLAVRADVYDAVGGMDALAFREDIGFVSKVVTKGYKLAHPLSVQVTVSARIHGRASGGMADCVRTWAAEADAGIPLLVENPATVEQRLLLRNHLRQRRGTGVRNVPAALRSGHPEFGGTPTRRLSAHEDIPLALQRLDYEALQAEGTVPVEVAIQRLLVILEAHRDLVDAA